MYIYCVSKLTYSFFLYICFSNLGMIIFIILVIDPIGQSMATLGLLRPIRLDINDDLVWDTMIRDSVPSAWKHQG